MVLQLVERRETFKLKVATPATSPRNTAFKRNPPLPLHRGVLHHKAMPILFPTMRSKSSSPRRDRIFWKKYMGTEIEATSAPFLTKLPSACPEQLCRRAAVRLCVTHTKGSTRAWYMEPQPPSQATRAATFPTSLLGCGARHYTSSSTDAGPK